MSHNVNKNLMNLLHSLVLFSTMFAVSCCTFRWNRSQSERAAGDTSNRESIYKSISAAGDIRTDLQLSALIQADQKNAASVVGLFSEAGYVDGGQTVIFEMEDGSGEVQRTEPGSKEPLETRKLTNDQLKSFLTSLEEFKTIGNYERPSFDGVRFELLHCRRSDKASPLKLEQRSMIMTLQDDAEAEPFRKLLAVFDSLNKSK
jgi:hypothetical protein